MSMLINISHFSIFSIQTKQIYSYALFCSCHVFFKDKAIWNSNITRHFNGEVIHNLLFHSIIKFEKCNDYLNF